MTEWYPKDKACIVGIGQTEFTRWGQISRPEFQLACEAILKAIADAGLAVKDIDGICSYANDRNEAALIAATLGMEELRFSNMFWGAGGGGSMASVMNASLGVATGTANYVVAFRSLAQGQFGRFGQSRAGAAVGGAAAFSAPYGSLTPAINLAAFQGRRHMHLYGTTSRHFGAISMASYKHAQRNPNAVMYGHPLTLEMHQKSRMIADPLHLYDCCQENDGSAAVVLTTPERARDLRHRPVYVMSAAQGSVFRQAMNLNCLDEDFTSPKGRTVARDLFARAGITPKDIDVAQIYENFTPNVLMALEDHGFCKRGEGGPFVETGRLEWPDGDLPMNTSGGNLAEAYIHGLELALEGTRQMRGTSTSQVQDAEICFLSSMGSVALSSNLILRR